MDSQYIDQVPLERKEEFDSFSKWLIESDCEILPPMNEWEILRYRHPVPYENETIITRTAIIYKNKKNALTFTGWSSKHYRDFLKKRTLGELANNKKLANSKKRDVTNKKNNLLKRDGSFCFYCHKSMEDDNMTIEHLFPSSKGGTSHMHNLVLAHEECNVKAGSKSIIAKVKIREGNAP